MAIGGQVVISGVVRAVWDDDVAEYYELAADGVTETLRRAYTAVETEQAAQRASRVTEIASDVSLRALLEAAIDTNRARTTTIDTAADNVEADLAALTNAQINANPGPVIRSLGTRTVSLARETADISQLVTALARFRAKRLESADVTGT